MDSFERVKLFSYIQFVSINMIPLLIQPHVKGITLREQKLYLKICQSYELDICFKRGLDLSKGVLRVSISQRALKLQSVKV